MASRFSLRTHRLAAAAVAAALALPVLAQPQQQQQQQPAATGAPASSTAAPHGGPRHHRAQREQHRHAQPGDRAQHHARRLAALKEQLQLTPAQEPAWTAFTAAVQPGERKARLDRQGMEQLTTPERIDRMRALRAQRAAEADRRGDATKAFYAALTPAQQKTFDARALRHHARMDGHRGGGHRGHGLQPGMRGADARPAPAARPAQ